ncbi:MAG: tetratricopeptide repeat protein [Culturomica sp.]|jgi:uncharacterized protein HemY|nr:tetratricopeptide repeat protein [Culturomica sp.]
MKKEVEKFLQTGEEENAIEFLENCIEEISEDENLLLTLGELYYRKGRQADALNKFNAVLRLNPNNRKAANYVSMINGILDYFCKDLLNP